MADDLQPSVIPVPWRRLLLPTEHGSWAFVLEPVCLGLLVAYSPGTIWLSLAVLFSFLARKPAKPALGGDNSTSAHRQQARVLLSVLVVLSLTALGFATAASSPAILLPLVLAVPGIGIFARQELSGQTRSLLAELVGTGICSLPLISMALAAGWPWASALSLGLVNLGRSSPTLLFVRTALRSTRGETGLKQIAVVAQFLVPGMLALLAITNQMPWPIVAINSVLSLRALASLSGIVPVVSAKLTGILEVFWGIAYVISVAIAYHSNGL